MILTLQLKVVTLYKVSNKCSLYYWWGIDKIMSALYGTKEQNNSQSTICTG
jgi:hypothetical protein